MKERTLQGKSVVITGAASGIGEALAMHCASLGAHLLLADIDPTGLERVAAAVRKSGVTCHTQVIDTGNESAIFSLAAYAKDTLGGADIVINNAGVGLVSPVDGLPIIDAQWLMNINFWGVVNGCRAFLPQLRTREDAVLVNISSIFAMVSVPTQSIYNASKAAVRAFSDSLREELVGSSVDVLSVHPGGIKTNIANKSRIVDVSMIADTPQEMRDNFARVARTTPAQAAAVIVRAIERRQTRVLIGADAKVMDWMFRLFPSRASHWVSAFGQWLRVKAQARAGRSTDKAAAR